ncbi:MAG TPA: type II secretion system protein GspM [Burkholderiaceae bacterium]
MKLKSPMSAGWLVPLQARWNVFWEARTRDERKYLAAGFAVVLLALMYLLLIEPAINGRAQLEKRLPVLHQQNAQMQALAMEAAALSGAGSAAPVPVSRDALEQSMKRHGVTAQSIALMGDFATVQLNGVQFAKVVAWLDESQRASRVTVQDANIVAAGAPGNVNATLTLRVARSE